MKVLAIRHISRENAGTIERFLCERGMGLEYWDIPAEADRQVSVSEYDAVISLGGPMGVYETERHPFVRHELEFLKALVRARKPVLGICLGAQMLAKALGADVFRGTQKEIGWYDVNLTPAAREDRVFSKLCGGSKGYPEGRLRVFQWHGDTFELPPGAVRLAYSPLYQNQAFRYDEFAYGLQFHVEMTGPMIQEWLEAGREELASAPYIHKDSILKEIPAYLNGLEKFSKQFCEEFFGVMA